MNEDSSSQRIKLIENNVAALLAVWKDFEGVTFVDNQTKTQIVTGFHLAYMNSVTNANFSGDIIEHIRTTLIPFSEKKVPVLWWIGPNSKPIDLDIHLEKFGFKKIDEPPGMYINLNDLDLNYQYPPELKVEVIKEVKQVEDFTTVFVAGMGGTEERRKELLKS